MGRAGEVRGLSAGLNPADRHGLRRGAGRGSVGGCPAPRAARPGRVDPSSNSHRRRPMSDPTEPHDPFPDFESVEPVEPMPKPMPKPAAPPRPTSTAKPSGPYK